MILDKMVDRILSKIDYIKEYTYEYNLNIEKFVENLILMESQYSTPTKSLLHGFHSKYFFTGNITIDGFYLKLNRHFGSSFLAMAIGTFIIKNEENFSLNLIIDYPRNLLLFVYYFIISLSLAIGIILVLQFTVIGFLIAGLVFCCSILLHFLLLSIKYQNLKTKLMNYLEKLIEELLRSSLVVKS